MVVYTLLKEHAFAVLKCQKNVPSDQSEMKKRPIVAAGRPRMKHKVPQDIKVTYSRTLCDIRTQKKETHRVKIAVGGGKLSYNGPVSTPTVDLTMVKLHWNSVLSITYGKYLIVDANNLYLENLMKKAEYYKIVLSIIPQEIIYKYDTSNKQSDGYLYVQF